MCSTKRETSGCAYFGIFGARSYAIREAAAACDSPCCGIIDVQATLTLILRGSFLFEVIHCGKELVRIQSLTSVPIYGLVFFRREHISVTRREVENRSSWYNGTNHFTNYNGAHDAAMIGPQSRNGNAKRIPCVCLSVKER